MEELIIGSRALKAAGEQYISKAKRHWDFDIICTHDVYEKYKKKLEPKIKKEFSVNKDKTLVIQTEDQNYEFDLALENSTNASLLKLVEEDKSLTNKVNGKIYASPNLIYTLKMSHRYLKNSPHFMKTMLDIKHLRSVGCDIPESLNDWYKARMKETYWYKHPKLDVKKDEFFQKEKYAIYEHDHIHLAMAHYDGVPAYEFYKPKENEVNCSKELFYSVDEQVRLYGSIEEILVLSLERSQICAPNVWTHRKSFEFAAMKLATSISSGFFREYVWEHFFKILSMYDEEWHSQYVKRFWKAVEAGIVKKIDG